MSDSPTCNCCGASSQQKALQVCGACRYAKYCGKECQQKDWPSHKKSCREHRDMIAAQQRGLDKAAGTRGSASDSKPKDTKRTYISDQEPSPPGPAAGLFLFAGSDFTIRANSMIYTTTTITGGKRNGRLLFCVRRQVNGPGNRVTVTEQWHDEAAYTAMHMGLVAQYDMEPNRAFDGPVGVMSEGGMRLGGTNRLWHTNPWGEMKIEYIRTVVPTI